MVHFQLFCARNASENILKEYDPIKKRKYLSKLDPAVDYPQKIFLKNKNASSIISWGEYRPLDMTDIKRIKGRLGDLLHPKDGLLLGVSDDNWYIETRIFLEESIVLLKDNYKHNNPYFQYKGRNNFILVGMDDHKTTKRD
jgi:hypothetical protein